MQRGGEQVREGRGDEVFMRLEEVEQVGREGCRRKDDVQVGRARGDVLEDEERFLSEISACRQLSMLSVEFRYATH